MRRLAVVLVACVTSTTACIDVDDAPTACASDLSRCGDASGGDTGSDTASNLDADAARVDTADVASDVTDTIDAPTDSACDGACVPGTTETVTGTCPGVFEKKQRTCASDCSWGTPACRIPSGWQPIKASPLSARIGYQAVWTGTEMIVWGGATYDRTTYFADGARYDPTKDAWTSIAAAPTGLAGRYGNAAVWTGSKMVVWGGDGAASYADGAAYDPSTNTWAMLPATAIDARFPAYAYSTTTNEVLIWGSAGEGARNDGSIFRPLKTEWSAFPSCPLAARGSTSFAWTGTQFMVFGGGNSAKFFNDGARYNPVTSTWSPIDAPPLGYVSRANSSQGSANGGLIVVGGFDATLTSLADGIYFDSAGAAQLVPPIPATVLPNPERNAGSTWCKGDRCWFWSGVQYVSSAPTVRPGGASFSVTTRTWSPMTSVGEPAGRVLASTVWTGTSAIVWGGTDLTKALPDGAIFTP
jgi:N-acetylneuraminic acid mutarotase